MANETIADIIAEMRALSNPISDGIIAINGRSIADRLEAARRRERGEIERLKERPKNCEVGTAEQQANRFLEFCNKDRPMISQHLRNQTICPLECPFNKSKNCNLAWAQMPYEEEKGGER